MSKEKTESKKGLRIGFDIDGVLTDMKGSSWALRIKDENLTQLFCGEARPLLNPKLFLHEDDEIFIITARSKNLREITQKWCDKYFPGVSIYQVDVKAWKSSDDWKGWFEEVARSKAKLINVLGLDVYFEDQPKTVTKLRELCPRTTIIQYGGCI